MTDDRKRKPEPPARPKATFGGETVEPRILMSVTWLAPGTAGNDTMVGTAGNDGLQGLGGNDTLMGNGGDDILRGGLGDDSLQGGSGIDLADYSTATGSVTVSLQTNTATGADGSDTLNSIEGVTGSAFDDVITGSIGNDTLSGGGGNDTIISSFGNDTVDGGTGVDTIDYRNAISAVTVDLTSAGPQNTGFGGGIDTLSNLEGIVGSLHNDTFAFTNPVDGAVYTVDGGVGSDKIDVSGFASSAVTFTNGHITIDLGGGQSFGIDYSNVETIKFADVNATVVTSNLTVGSFVNSGIFIDGDEAFRMDVGGAGSLDWSYDTATDTLTIADTNGTNATTSVEITDLNGTDLAVGTITIDENLGSLVSNVDIDTIEITRNSTTISSITIGDGGGTLGTFRTTTGTIDAPTTIHADVGAIDLSNKLNGPLVVDGDLGSLTMGQLDVNGGITVHGNAGSLTMGDVLGTVQVDGNVGALSTAYVANDITVLGDLGSAGITSVASGATITVQSAVGTLDFQVGGVQHGGTFATPTHFIFDGATQTAVTIGTNVAPIAHAGPDQVVNEGDLVTLSGIGSTDADGDRLSYTWVQTAGPTVALSSSNGAQPTFTAPQGLTNSSVTFNLIVGDGTTSSLVDSVTITINADNDAPTANAGVDQTVSEGDTVTLTGLASTDPEAQGLTYTWVQTSGPGVTLSNANAARPTFTAPEGLTNTAVQFSLTISDGTNTSSVDSVTVTINADNDAPSAEAGDDQAVSEGDTVTLTGVASSDPEAQGLTYTWVQTSGPAVTLSNATTSQPTFAAPEGLTNTAVQFSLTVSDGTSTSSVDTITVTINADNDAPSANAGTDQTVTEGQTVTLTGVASSDPEAQGLTYTWVQTSGPAVTLNNATTAQPTFTAPEGLTNTAVQFSLTVSDGTSTSSVDTVAITINADNDAPTANAGADQTVKPSDTVQLRATGGDPEGSSLSYAWRQVSGSPVTISDPTTAAPTFVAPGAAAGETLIFIVDVSDGATTTTDTVAIAVAANAAPEVRVEASPTANSGDPIALSAIATDADGDGLRYTWTQLSGPPATLMATDQPRVSFVAPFVSHSTVLVFQVEVTDGTSTTARVVAVSVEPIIVDEPTTGAPDPVPAPPAPPAPPASTPPPVEMETPQPTSPRPAAAPAESGEPPHTTTDASSSSGAVTSAAPGDSNNVPRTSASADVSAPETTPNSRDDAGDAEAQLLASDPQNGQPDLVVATAGRDVELAPTLPVPAGGDVNYVWKQTAGTVVAFDETADGKLRVRLPEVFSEEELVFEVEMLSGAERVVQEITVQVQPVSMTARPLGIDDAGRVEIQSAAVEVSDATGHGLGRMWAALVSFFATKPGRSER